VPLASVISESGGLTQQQVEQRRTQYGYNILDAAPRRALVLQFIARFGNPLVIMLLAASGIAALTGDAVSFVIISVIVCSASPSTWFRNTRPTAPPSGCGYRSQRAPS